MHYAGTGEQPDDIVKSRRGAQTIPKVISGGQPNLTTGEGCSRPTGRSAHSFAWIKGIARDPKHLIEFMPTGPLDLAIGLAPLRFSCATVASEVRATWVLKIGEP